MRKIVPHLWFDTEALEAAKFYTSLFDDSSIESSSKMEGTPSGTVETAKIVLSGQEFMLLSAGPLFKFTPAVSFMVSCETKAEVGSAMECPAPGRRRTHVAGRVSLQRKVWVADG